MPTQTIIKSIKINNVRGISSKKFIFDNPEMLGNKFHLLVAPNGFGKSSFAGAFSSLKPKSLKIPTSLLHKNDEANKARIEITYAIDGEPDTLIFADEENNTISNIFSIAVISSKVKPHAKTNSAHSQFVKAIASLVIEPIVLVENIPRRPAKSIATSNFTNTFGVSENILPNIQSFAENYLWLGRFLSLPNLVRLTQKTVWKKIDAIVDDVSRQTGTAVDICKWIEVNKLAQLRSIPELQNIAALISDFSELTEVDKFLIAYQFAKAYQEDKENLKEWYAWITYLNRKDRCIQLLKSANSNPDWIELSIKETKSKLVVEFPLATIMSNGQRDLFSLLAQLMKVEFQLSGTRAILIVDEVFDYLDECNLLAAQYYISKFVDQFKSDGAEIFPLFLTHLDPDIFRHSALGLGKKDIRKVHHLDKFIDSSKKAGIAKMVILRDETALKPHIGKYFFHYHPDNCDQETVFVQNGLKKAWGKSYNFYKYVFAEFKKYREGASDTDYVAACVATRIAIEKHSFDQLAELEQRKRFTDEFNKGTSDKLDFVESLGGMVPESHRLLGLLYNDILHHKPNFDYISAIVSKMKNPAIRGMISEIPVPKLF